jgi:hypothetical protein
MFIPRFTYYLQSCSKWVREWQIVASWCEQVTFWCPLCTCIDQYA